jgi:hypothetical protein
MGLDMYLYKAKRQKDFSEETVVKICREIDNLDCLTDNVLKNYLAQFAYEVEFDNIKRFILSSRIAYWRKANMIHGWIYEHRKNEALNDYDPLVLDEYKINQLLKVCKEVMKEEEKVLKTHDTEKVEILLPTKSGFFFGSCEYDIGYFEDVESAIKQLEDVLTNVDFQNEVVFYLADY